MDPQAKLDAALKSDMPEKRSVVPLKQPTIPIDYKNIQGDVFPGLTKFYEQFIFFTINNPTTFKTQLKAFKSNITTAQDVVNYLLEIQPVRIRNMQYQTAEKAPIPDQYQIAFSHAAFSMLGIGEVGDSIFQKGPMYLGAQNLGDPPKPNAPGSPYIPDWDSHWMDPKRPIHGVIVTLPNEEAGIQKTFDYVTKEAFKDSIRVVYSVLGQVQDGKMRGHEYFGFMDGISQPAMRGMTKPHKGQLQCDAGVLIQGAPGDTGPDEGGLNSPQPPKQRPAWASGGSIMAFRQLKQDVSGFDDFLKKNPAPIKQGEDPNVAVERRGALMFGRWRSGCPMDLSWENDNETIAANVDLNNDFNYDYGTNFSRCPVTSHIRKTAPRKILWLARDLEQNLIMRGSIPYQTKDKTEKGLLFVSYQAHLNLGFDFIQEKWCNAKKFPPAPDTTPTNPHNSFAPPGELPGYDPILGAANGQERITYQQQTPNDPYGKLTMPHDFIIPRGGEYFWTPGMVGIDAIVNNGPWH